MSNNNIFNCVRQYGYLTYMSINITVSIFFLTTFLFLMLENFYYLSSHKTSFVDILQVVTFNNIPRKYLFYFCNICYFEEIFFRETWWLSVWDITSSWFICFSPSSIKAVGIEVSFAVIPKFFKTCEILLFGERLKIILVGKVLVFIFPILERWMALFAATSIWNGLTVTVGLIN